MGGIIIIFWEILISIVPIVGLIIWFKYKKYPFSLLAICASFFTGLVTVFVAFLFHNNFEYLGHFIPADSRWVNFYKNFIQFSFSEEISRFILLLIFYLIYSRIRRNENSMQNEGWFCAVGIIAGFGFAVLESTVIDISYANFTWMRIFTAAPLHAACGCRVAFSVANLKKYPAQSIFRFFSAVAIHGLYNILIIRNHLPSQIAAILIALFSFASSMLLINRRMGELEEGASG